MAHAQISVRVKPSSGAPAGWKSVARVKSAKGMLMNCQPGRRVGELVVEPFRRVRVGVRAVVGDLGLVGQPAAGAVEPEVEGGKLLQSWGPAGADGDVSAEAAEVDDVVRGGQDFVVAGLVGHGPAPPAPTTWVTVSTVLPPCACEPAGGCAALRSRRGTTPDAATRGRRRGPQTARDAGQHERAERPSGHTSVEVHA